MIRQKEESSRCCTSVRNQQLLAILAHSTHRSTAQHSTPQHGTARRRSLVGRHVVPNDLAAPRAAVVAAVPAERRQGNEGGIRANLQRHPPKLQPNNSP